MSPARRIAHMIPAAVLGLAAALPATAQSLGEPPDARPVRFVLGFGLTHGGDKLAEADTYGGDTENVRSGSGLDLHAGAEWRALPFLSFQATLGHHDDRVYDWGSNVGFRRSTAELIGHFWFDPRFRAGLGIHKTYDAVFSSRIDGIRSNTDYTGKIAPVVEAEYFFNPMFSLKGRYVHERYEQRFTGRRLDGNYGGVYLGLYF